MTSWHTPRPGRIMLDIWGLYSSDWGKRSYMPTSQSVSFGLIRLHFWDMWCPMRVFKWIQRRLSLLEVGQGLRPLLRFIYVWDLQIILIVYYFFLPILTSNNFWLSCEGWFGTLGKNLSVFISSEFERLILLKSGFRCFLDFWVMK